MLISTVLKRADYMPLVATSPQEGLRLAYEHRPDLVLLDVMMPELDGLEVARRLRSVSEVPIIFISGGKDSVEDIIAGLDTGGNDYIIKPFKSVELLARIKAQLRRHNITHGQASKSRTAPDFQINYEARLVTLDDEEIALSAREFELLSILVRNAGEVVTREQLIDTVWGDQTKSADASLKVYVSSLRRKLERNPSYPEFITTVRGMGYRFQLPH